MNKEHNSITVQQKQQKNKRVVEHRHVERRWRKNPKQITRFQLHRWSKSDENISLSLSVHTVRNINDDPIALAVGIFFTTILNNVGRWAYFAQHD